MKITTKETTMSAINQLKYIQLKTKSKYFVLNVGKQEMRNVPSGVFSSTVAPTIVWHDTLVKYKGTSRAEARILIEKFFSSWKPHGLVDTLKALPRAMGELVDILDVVAAVRTKLTNDVRKLCEVDWCSLIGQLSETLSITMWTIHQPCWASLLSFGLRVWNLINFINGELSRWKPHGLAEIAISTASLMLPPCFMVILKRMQMLTSAKVLDDPSSFQQLLNCVLDLFDAGFQKVSGVCPVWLRQAIEGVLQLCGRYNSLREAKQLLQEFARDPKLIVNPMFTLKVKKVYDLSQAPEMMEYAQRSSYVRSVCDSITMLWKSVLSHSEVVRQEPCCFVFEGPPGCYKSGTVGKILQIMQLPVYTHIVKTQTDGKDFYDTYNGEPIFAMDDVGQQGNDQWRTLINMVSTMKMPLTCAEAKLKNTKFFTSDTIICTTNNFMHLHGLTPADAIQDVHALWRRGYVFDMSNVRLVRGVVTGKFSFKTYDLQARAFVEGFQPEVRAYMFEHYKEDVKPAFACVDGDQSQHLEWIYKIILAHREVRKGFLKQGQMDEDVCARIRNFPRKIQFVPHALDEFEDAPYAFSRYSPIEDFTESDIDEREEILQPVLEDLDTTIGDWQMEGVIEEKSWLKILKEYVSSFAKSSLSFLSSQEIAWDEIMKWGGLFLGLGFVSGALGVAAAKLEQKQAAQKAKDLIAAFEALPLIKDQNVKETLFKKLILNEKLNLEDFRPDAIEDFHKTVTVKAKENGKQDNVHTFIQKAASQSYPIRVNGCDDPAMMCVGLVSGHSVILPSHAVPLSGKGFISVYDRDSTSALVDNMEFVVAYRNLKEDVVVCKLPANIPSHWRNLSKGFKYSKFSETPYLCTLGEYFQVPQSVAKLSGAPINYSIRNKVFYTLPKENAYVYDVTTEGICGSLLVSKDGFVQGIHVTGMVNANIGATCLWSEQTMKDVCACLEQDKGFLSPITIKKPIGESGYKLDMKAYGSTPKETNFIPSQLHGVFPITRTPAELSKYGDHTIKDVAMKSFKASKDVAFDTLAFAETCVGAIIPTFKPIDDYTVIKGNEFLAPLNKDSSNGYGCLKDKSAYINFESGTVTSLMARELADLEAKVYAGDYHVEDWLWSECGKDELRGLKKDGVPRSFRISKIHLQFLMKRYFGDFVQQMMQDRDNTEIMIGVNPFSEWDDIGKKLQKLFAVWAGDIGSFDGNMLPQAQKVSHDMLMAKFQGNEIQRAMASFLLRNMQCTAVVLNDDVWMTTHSMPSGSYLTAMLNSVINRLYTAMWYYESVPNPSVQEFYSEVVDYVYGDDKVNGLRSGKLAPYLNAISMEKFFLSIGMTFTTADKSKITKPFETMDEISFLKRKFVYHPSVQRIMCPLDMETLFSGLSWVDKKKDALSVLQDKIATFQRELYLHVDLDRVHILNQLKQRCVEEGVPFKTLSGAYMQHVYTKELDFVKSHSWGGSRYA